MVGGSGGKVVARLAADGTVYTTNVMKNQFTNLVNYKIKTDGDFLKRKASLSSTALGVPTTVVDLGKQLLQCARDNDIEGVRSAIARGAPYAHDWLGLTALHFAAMNDQYEICKLLLNSGINKDAKTKVDRTPLHFACFYGHYKIVQLLLSRNCQVNPRDMLLMTPLHWAVEKCYKSIVRLLLNYNADVTVVSKFDKTPIALAVLSEQADILQELENVRQKQITRKMNEEIKEETVHCKKETSEAVNSIMNLCNDDNDGGGSDIYCETLEVNGGANDVTIINLDENTTSDSVKNSTINMLESHGISLMPANNDESKDLLNTALKNGRQLILSEGGKLLLSETKQRSNNVVNTLNRVGGGNISNQRSSSNANVQLVNNNNNNNNTNAISKWRIKSEPPQAAASTDGNSNHHHLTTSTTTTSSNNSYSNVVGGTHNVPLSQNNNNKMRAPPSNLNNNIIVKKQRTSILQHAPTILGGGGGNGVISGGGGGGGGVNAQLAKITTANIAGKNKNIRLMSLNDFKKICGNTNLKPVQMSLSDTNNKTQVTNIRDIQTAKLQNANIIELTNLNETSSSDKDSSEAARGGIMHKKPQPTASVRYYPAKLATVSTASGTPAHLVNSSTTTASISSSSHQSSPQKLRLRQSAVHIQQFKPVGSSTSGGDGTITPTSIASNAFLNNDNHNVNGNGRVVTTTLGDGSIICSGSTTLTTSSSSSTNTHTQSHVVPLLTTPQICRQLLDLRKQHEELRRKYDLAEKEKEELRQRVERLEEFLLVEKTDIYSASS